jgi:uncharacterized membrane protein YhaH (DUF805 family)
MASDVWALGATMYELFVGDTPFGEHGGLIQKSGADIPNINSGNYSEDLKETVVRCLAAETWNRPTAKQLGEWCGQHFRGEKIRFKSVSVDKKPVVEKPERYPVERHPAKERSGIEWYAHVWKHYACFSGRARRKEYWMFTLFNSLFMLAAGCLTGLLAAIVTNNGDTGLLVMYTSLCLYLLAALIPSLAVTVRRLHDMGNSGWYLLLNLIPWIGSLIVFIFTVRDSEQGENKYGPNPKTNSDTSASRQKQGQISGNEKPQRHPFIAVWLILMMTGYGLTFLIFAGLILDMWHEWEETYFAIYSILNLSASILLWRRVKFGFWLIVFSSLMLCCEFTFRHGYGNYFHISNALSIIILYGVLQIKKAGKSYWRTLNNSVNDATNKFIYIVILIIITLILVISFSNPTRDSLYGETTIAPTSRQDTISTPTETVDKTLIQELPTIPLQQESKSSSSSMQTVTTDDFSFKVPKTFKKQYYDGQLCYGINDNYPYVMIETIPKSDMENYTVSGIADLVVSVIRESGTAFSKIKSETVTVNGKSAHFIDMKITSENIPLTYRIIVIMGKKNIYCLYIWTLSSQYSISNKAVINEIAYSFKEL